MISDVLHFGFASTRPPLEGVEVYERGRAELLGVEFVFDVIGVSHHVSAPDRGFHEVASCEHLPDGETHRMDLEPGLEATFSFEADGLACETDIWVDRGSTLPDESAVDVEYVFSEAALTAIVVGEDRYETYHTYPEYDLTLQSETRLWTTE